MDEWTDPRYADVVERYRESKRANPPKPRRGWWSAWSKRPYGDPFVIVIDTETMTPYTTGRGRTDT